MAWHTSILCLIHNTWKLRKQRPIDFNFVSCLNIKYFQELCMRGSSTIRTQPSKCNMSWTQTTRICVSTLNWCVVLITTNNTSQDEVESHNYNFKQSKYSYLLATVQTTSTIVSYFQRGQKWPDYNHLTFSKVSKFQSLTQMHCLWLLKTVKCLLSPR